MNHFRVLLMDQRGTGLSAAITPASLVRRGTPQQQAEYLAHFRSDAGAVGSHERMLLSVTAFDAMSAVDRLFK